jgi:hypothetical protein
VHLVEKIGKRVVQISLQTTSTKEAKKLRTLRDLEWDAQFEAAETAATADEGECLGFGAAAPSHIVMCDDDHAAGLLLFRMIMLGRYAQLVSDKRRWYVRSRRTG